MKVSENKAIGDALKNVKNVISNMEGFKESNYTDYIESTLILPKAFRPIRIINYCTEELEFYIDMQIEIFTIADGHTIYSASDIIGMALDRKCIDCVEDALADYLGVSSTSLEKVTLCTLAPFCNYLFNKMLSVSSY